LLLVLLVIYLALPEVTCARNGRFKAKGKHAHLRRHKYAQRKHHRRAGPHRVPRPFSRGHGVLAHVMSSSVLSTARIPLDSPAVILSQNDYTAAPLNGNIGTVNLPGPWTNVLSTASANNLAVTRVYTDNKSTVIVAYRGSQGDEDWVADFESIVSTPCTMNGVKCGNVGSGFLSVFNTDIAQVQAAVTPYVKKGYQLVLTGHSLGGATSSLAAFYFATLFNIKPTLITFASPRVGDSTWVSAFNARMSGAVSRRYVTKIVVKVLFATVSTSDIVTTVPPEYSHIASTEIDVTCPSIDPLTCHGIASYITGMKTLGGAL